MINRISWLLKWGVVRFAESAGARLLRPDGTALALPYLLPFPDLTAPSILASFVAGATASQSGTTVTVSATAHGIVGNATRNGHRIYYPGSASIPAGWYAGFAWVDANTVTFQRSAATVASESVNGGSAYLSNTTIASLTLPGGSMGPRGRITLRYQRAGDATAGSKNVRLTLGGTVLGVHVLNSSMNGEFTLSVRNLGSESNQAALLSADGTSTAGAVSTAAVDTTAAQTVAIAAILVNAGQWVAIPAAELEVVKL